MPRLELDDTVVLKSNRKLYGTVERTHYEGHEPLQDQLIVRHAPVATDDLASFARSGVPPKDHVFVFFADEAQGSALVHEDHVELVSRSFTLGDTVKREGNSIQGTIVSCSESFTLQPVWVRDNDGEGFATPDSIARIRSHSCTSECPIPAGPSIQYPHLHDFIYNVPDAELKRSEDVLESDFVVCQEWMGVVQDAIPHVTLLMDDGSIVAVEYPDELYIPVPEFDNPIVSLPEYDEGLPRPDVLVAQHGWSRTIPLLPDYFRSGRFVVTSSRNLRNGRWLRGHFDRNQPTSGYIIDVRTSSMKVNWLACEPLTLDPDLPPLPPSEDQLIYENVPFFPSRSELRRNKKVLVADPSRYPRHVEDRRRHKVLDDAAILQPRVHTSSLFRAGDFVKFRDPTGAAVKYQGKTTPDGVLHGKFDKLSGASVLGFDLNDLKVVCGKQSVKVRWQDGCVSEHPSLDLYRPGLFKPDLQPADIVFGKEGLSQRRVAIRDEGFHAPLSDWAPFNEMTYFEHPHELDAKKVGVVQSFDPVERIARVRWYASPFVQLSNAGYVLNGRSRLGVLGEEIEEVSSYEITIFSALARSLKDVITLTTTRPAEKGRKAMENLPGSIESPAGPTSLSFIPIMDRPRWLQYAVKAIEEGDPHLPPTSGSASGHGHRAKYPDDWVGEIVELGVDGTVTVRIGMGDRSQDVLVEHDQIVLVIDEGAINDLQLESDDDSMLDVDYSSEDLDDDDYSDDLSAVQETVEYEGGQRLDNDSDDENWEDSEDAMSVDKNDGFEAEAPRVLVTSNIEEHGLASQERQGDIRQDLADKDSQVSDLDKRNNLGQGSALLRAYAIDTAPLQFAVLDRDPPSNQYEDTGARRPDTSTNFMRRVTKEHKALRSSLPVGEIYVRTYENRLDLMRCLIIGPADTPYEFAPFLVDLQLTAQFPKEPPIAHFHSWTSGLGRINPNLYENGKICLSLLGTWQGKDTETWSEKATILQLLVSLQALVLVKEPFYNEAGFEGRAGTNEYLVESRRYTEESFLVARKFITHALQHPVPGFEDVLAWTYLPRDGYTGLLNSVLQRCKRLREISGTDGGDGELTDGNGIAGDPTKAFLQPLSKGGIVMLKKTIQSWEEMVGQLSI